MLFIEWPNWRQAGIFESQKYGKAFPSYQRNVSALKHFLAPKQDFTLDPGLEINSWFPLHFKGYGNIYSLQETAWRSGDKLSAIAKEIVRV